MRGPRPDRNDPGDARTTQAPVAQRIEHLTTDQKVRGSNPFGRTSSDPYLVGAGLLYLLPGSAARAEALRGGAARSFTCGQGSVTYRWFLVTCRWFCATYARAVGATCALVDALFTCGQAIANRWVNYASIRQRTSSLASATRSTGNNAQQQVAMRSNR